MERNVINVENFKNHASIVMWSLGNECGGGSNFAAALKAIKAIDPTRPTQYEPFGMGGSNPADVDSRMYTSVGEMARFATDKKLTKPFYLCEYAHAMFNSMGSIGEYNDLFDSQPALLGGAIWEWEDQGIWNRRNPNRQFIAFGGGFKEVPNDHYFIHKGVVFSDRSPKPHYPEMKRAYQWIGVAPADMAAGTIKVRNKYAFITLEGFVGHWTLSEDGREIQRGNLPELALLPGAEQTVPVTIKPFTPKPGALYLMDVSFTLKKDQRWAKSGYEVAHAQFAMPQTAQAVTPNASDMPSLQLAEEGTNVTITGKGFQVVFNKDAGTFSQLIRDGKKLLVDGSGPRLHLWRAPHQTDDMWAYRDWQRYGLTDLKRTVKQVAVKQLAPGVVRIEATINAEGKQDYSLAHSAVYTVYGDGSIVAENSVTPTGRRIPWARLGVRLELASQYEQVTYLGRGPMENYGDRKRGSDIGLYSATTRELMTPYAKPMECGNHEDVRWVAVSGKRLPALMAQAEDGVLQFSALPYTDEVMTPIEYSVDLPASRSTVLTIAKRTLGVGSNGCGPRPLEPYMLWSAPETFSYILRLIPAGTKDFAPIGRKTTPQDRVKLAANTSAPALIRGKAIAASSFEPGEGEMTNAVDGLESTYWHSRWSGEPARPPHFLTLDFERDVTLAAVNYVARTDGDNGRVRDYEIYLSKDGQNWGEAAVKGSISPESTTEVIRLPKPPLARYLKFVVLSEQRNQAFASIAELSGVAAAKNP
jgi:beta-galactosidase